MLHITLCMRQVAMQGCFCLVFFSTVSYNEFVACCVLHATHCTLHTLLHALLPALLHTLLRPQLHARLHTRLHARLHVRLHALLRARLYALLHAMHAALHALLHALLEGFLYDPRDVVLQGRGFWNAFFFAFLNRCLAKAWPSKELLSTANLNEPHN